MPDLGDLGAAAENIKDFVVEKGTSAAKSGASKAGKTVAAAGKAATSMASNAANAVSDAVLGDDEEPGDSRDYTDSGKD